MICVSHLIWLGFFVIHMKPQQHKTFQSFVHISSDVMFVFLMKNYTVRQMYGLIPPVRPFFLTAGGNLYQFHQSAPWDFHKTPQAHLHPHPLTKFYSPWPFLSCPSSSFMRIADFSSHSKRQCVTFALNIFRCVLSLCIHCNFKTKWQSCQPITQV